MKKLLIHSTTLVAAIALAVAVPTRASAQTGGNGTITFTGSVTGQTCTISGNGGGSTFTVPLSPVSSSALSTVGNWAVRTPFSISLTNCTAPPTGSKGQVYTLFELSSGDVDNTTGYLKAEAGTGAATGVELQLLNNPDTTPIKLNAATGAAENSEAVTLANNAATLNYYVQYVATAAVTTGTVTSKVVYTLQYN